jgi:hypothetical protein
MTVRVFHLDWTKARALEDDRKLFFEITMMGNTAYVNDALEAGLYTEVAEVDTDSFDTAYRLTNHIESSWTENEGVTAKGEKNRSTSVGDLMGPDDGSFHIVSNFGFNKVTWIPKKIEEVA